MGANTIKNTKTSQEGSDSGKQDTPPTHPGRSFDSINQSAISQGQLQLHQRSNPQKNNSGILLGAGEHRGNTYTYHISGLHNNGGQN